MKRLTEISFWEEIIVYNAKKKNDDIQIKKCSMLLKLYFQFFFFC